MGLRKILNPNANKGVFLDNPEKLVLRPETKWNEPIETDYIRFLINNGSEITFYKLATWLRIREAVLSRDNYECQRCKYNKKLTTQETHMYIHHIAELKLYPFYATWLDNLVTLCYKCHEEVHERDFVTKALEKKKLQTFTNFDSTEKW